MYAPNVRSYGGVTLIQALIDVNDANMVFIVNDTLKLQREPDQLRRSGGSFTRQWNLERELKQSLTSDSILLSLANKPPFFRLPCYTVSALLSVFAIDIPPSVPLTFSRYIKSRIQIALNVVLKNNTDAFLARSYEMIEACQEKTRKHSLYFPFVTGDSPLVRSFDTPRPTRDKATFFYPTDAMPHKNIKNTLKAWQILADRGVNARLNITVDQNELNAISKTYPAHLVEPLGYVDEQALNAQYSTSDALFFPSLMESFPLPIIEARRYNLPIVSSERTFIREQIDPEETFDPLSPASMADAVQRIMGLYNAYSDRPKVQDLPAFLRSQRATSKFASQEHTSN